VGMRRILVLVTASLSLVMLSSPAAYAGDGPSGFWWGSDSNGPAPSGSVSTCASSSAPYLEPNVTRSGCGHYGGYFGEVGGYWSVLGCGGSNAWNVTGAGDAYTNFTSYTDGIGTSAYYFGGGPGMDPNYNGTTSEAYAWGKRQAEKAKSLAGTHSYFDSGILVLDVEDDYPSGVPTGWNEVLVSGSCSSVRFTGISPSVDRATFNGFWDDIWNNSAYWIAAYSSPGEWSGIFGTGSDSSLTGTMQWTADWGQNCINPGPYGWTQGSGSCSSNSASFFGGISSSSSCAFAWQWASRNGGDYDQIDANREYSCK
jgi:hypothetical protein